MITLKRRSWNSKRPHCATTRHADLKRMEGGAADCTVIVQMGTLKIGDPFICGDYNGK
jgi:hypothetical protein